MRNATELIDDDRVVGERLFPDRFVAHGDRIDQGLCDLQQIIAQGFWRFSGLRCSGCMQCREDQQKTKRSHRRGRPLKDGAEHARPSMRVPVHEVTGAQIGYENGTVSLRCRFGC